MATLYCRCQSAEGKALCDFRYREFVKEFEFHGDGGGDDGRLRRSHRDDGRGGHSGGYGGGYGQPQPLLVGYRTKPTPATWTVSAHGRGELS